MKTHVRIEIDHLVLEGFSPSEARRIVDSVEKEIRDRLTANSFSGDTTSARIEQIDAGVVGWKGFRSARRVGEQVAEAVFRGESYE